MVTPDGAPIAFMARLNGVSGLKRVTGPELMIELCRLSAVNGWSNYFYGGSPGVPEILSEKLKARFPRLVVAGTYSPPFGPLSPVEESEHLKAMAGVRPQIVWVGLGCPKQEAWMHRNAAQMSGALMIGVGAAFDFWSGRVRRAPLVMRALGVEWLYRLVSQPRRLWRRYLVLAPRFLVLALLDTARGKIVRVPSNGSGRSIELGRK